MSDNGIGIPADKIGSLFTEFKQTDATIASEYSGTGLGLSITEAGATAYLAKPYSPRDLLALIRRLLPEG